MGGRANHGQSETTSEPIPSTLASDSPAPTENKLLVRFRWSIVAAVVILCLTAAARLWFLSGLVRRISIAGPSMAPALLGRHCEVVCSDCGFPFAADAEHVPADGLAACPNCGFPANDLSHAQVRPADRVLIDGWPLLWRRPQRGDVVALAAPQEAGAFAVKRVAASGGEQLSIRGGDLYVGESIVRKSLAEWHAVRMVVHDNAYAPRRTKDLPPRWHPQQEATRWTSGGQRFECAGLPAAADRAADSVDWLEYTHWPCTANVRLRGVPSPLTDNDSFNQGETRRTLNVVPDVMVSCRIRLTGSGRLVLAAVDGQQRFELEIEPRQRLVLRRGAEVLLDQPLKLSLGRGTNKLEFGLCDQQVLLAIGGRTIVRHAYERPAGPQPEVLHPLAIGSGGVGLSVDELRVWRDIYYLDPQGLPRTWRLAPALAAQEIAVLGDNQPVSVDSRQFDPPGILLRTVRGRVERPFWMAP